VSSYKKRANSRDPSATPVSEREPKLAFTGAI